MTNAEKWARFLSTSQQFRGVTGDIYVTEKGYYATRSIDDVAKWLIQQPVNFCQILTFDDEIIGEVSLFEELVDSAKAIFDVGFRELDSRSQNTIALLLRCQAVDRQAAKEAPGYFRDKVVGRELVFRVHSAPRKYGNLPSAPHFGVRPVQLQPDYPDNYSAFECMTCGFVTSFDRSLRAPDNPATEADMGHTQACEGRGNGRRNIVLWPAIFGQ